MGTPEAVSPLTWQRAAIRDQRLGTSAVAVAAALVTIAPGQPGDFYGSVPKIMSLSRLGERAVRGVLAQLQQLGYLFQVKRGGRRGLRAEASTWRLTLSIPASGAGWESEEIRTPQPAQDAGLGVPNLHETAFQPAPSAVPREKDFQEPNRSSHQVGADRARADDEEGVDAVHTPVPAKGVRAVDTLEDLHSVEAPGVRGSLYPPGGTEKGLHTLQTPGETLAEGEGSIRRPDGTDGVTPNHVPDPDDALTSSTPTLEPGSSRRRENGADGVSLAYPIGRHPLRSRHAIRRESGSAS